MFYTVPDAMLVDEDTNTFYYSDHEHGMVDVLGSRNVIWKYDVARQRARLFAGHLDSRYFAKSTFKGVGGKAISASLSRIYAMALHPVTKEVHFISNPYHLLKVDAKWGFAGVAMCRVLVRGC